MRRKHDVWMFGTSLTILEIKFVNQIPTKDGKSTRGESDPANPALVVEEPRSTTIGSIPILLSIGNYISYNAKKKRIRVLRS